MNRHRQQTFTNLARLGLTEAEASELVRASATLHTWGEHECNGAIQRDEKTNVPYWYNTDTGKKIGRTSDRETGALKRAKAVAEKRGLLIYHQTDPRGCALYIYRQADLRAYASRFEPTKIDIDSCYSSVATAVVP